MNRILKALLTYLIKGILVVVPLGAAIFLIYWLFTTFDSALNLSGSLWIDAQTGQSVYIPGLGIATVLFILLMVGIIITYLVTEPIKNWFDRWMKKFPLFNFFYSSIKDLTEAFVGDEKKFNEPVIVEINESGLKKIGFLTQKDLTEIGLAGEVAVYFPLSYSFAGQVCIVKKDRVKPLKMKGPDAMKFVVSGGVSGLE
jgi:uncharacterized membrane protein